MAKGFTYHKRDAATVSARAEQKGNTFLGIIKDDFKTWRPKKGNNYVRFLPPTWDNPEHYGLDVYAHYSVGPDRASILCLSKMKNQKCPICEEVQKAEKAEDKELAGELRARKQVVAWMIDLDAKDKGPMIWAQSWTIDRDIAMICKDDRTREVFFIDNPDEGYNVSFNRDGEGINTNYGGFKIDRKASSVEPEWLEWVAEFPIPDCLEWRDYDEILAIYEGGEEPDPEPAAPTRRPSSGSGGAAANRKTPTKTAAREEPEAEEQEDEPEEEPAAPPVRKRGAAPVRDDGADDGYTQPPLSKTANGAAKDAAAEPQMTSAQRLKKEMEARRAARK